MNLKTLLITILTLPSLLLGCYKHVDVLDGQLPEAAMAKAAEMVGTYTGNFDHQGVSFTLTLEGRRLVLTPLKPLLFGRCAERVGDVFSVYIGGKEKDQLGGVRFDFDPGRCVGIRGRALWVSIPKKSTRPLWLSVYDHSEYVQYCDRGGCSIQEEEYYITGRALKTTK